MQSLPRYPPFSFTQTDVCVTHLGSLCWAGEVEARDRARELELSLVVLAAGSDGVCHERVVSKVREGSERVDGRQRGGELELEWAERA